MRAGRLSLTHQSQLQCAAGNGRGSAVSGVAHAERVIWRTQHARWEAGRLPRRAWEFIECVARLRTRGSDRSARRLRLPHDCAGSGAPREHSIAARSVLTAPTPRGAPTVPASAPAHVTARGGSCRLGAKRNGAEAMSGANWSEAHCSGSRERADSARAVAAQRRRRTRSRRRTPTGASRRWRPTRIGLALGLGQGRVAWARSAL